jgi:hypothetical protein
MHALPVNVYSTAAAELGPTLAGTAFWLVLLTAAVALFGATIVSIAQAPLSRRSRNRWIWFVVLAPGVGIIMWFTSGRRPIRRRPLSG